MKYIFLVLYLFCFFIAALCLSAASLGVKKGLISSAVLLLILAALFACLAVLLFRAHKKRR